ncbi:phosphopantothenoylcysteine decarboxylase [Candidatus Latescibacterota bacterium]
MEHGVSKKVLVTSGPTRAYVDSIRYFSNTSSGSLGSKIVEELIERNIPVIHIYGAGSATPKNPDSELLESIEIVTVDDLIDAVKRSAVPGKIKAVVHLMAVLDYAPESKLLAKKKSGDDFWDIRLVQTPKVIGIMRYLLPDAFFAGFKLEKGISGEQLVERAGELMEKYLLDIVIANDIDQVSEERHEAVFVGKDKNILARKNTKKEIAETLAERLSLIH